MRGRRRLIAAAVVVVAGAGGTAVWAATRANDVVTTVTGCVSSNGQLRNVAISNGTPATCRAGDVAVTLSSGDITGIETPADGGLTGGAPDGTATLALQQRFRLPQGCASGDVIRFSSALQYWTCGSTFAPHAFDVFTPNLVTVTAVGSLADQQRVLTAQVPPGKYVVSVTVDATKSDGTGTLRCNTFATPGDASGNVLVSETLGFNTTLSGTSGESLPSGGAIVMACRQLTGATGSAPTVSAEIVASSVESLSVAADQYGG